MAQKSEWSRPVTHVKERVKGKAGVPVVVVEFSDFQCPSCKRAVAVMQDLLKVYPDDVLFVFKHFPLEHIHKWARLSAQAAECAGRQGKFWEFHDQLFERQEEWSKSGNAKEDFHRMAGALGLNRARFDACLGDPKTEQVIAMDIAEAQARQVGSTPTFFVGEFRLVGATQLRENGARIIEVLRNEAKRKGR